MSINISLRKVQIEQRLDDDLLVKPESNLASKK